MQLHRVPPESCLRQVFSHAISSCMQCYQIVYLHDVAVHLVAKIRAVGEEVTALRDVDAGAIVARELAGLRNTLDINELVEPRQH